MSDASIAALDRIADLLARRVEQQEEMARKADARLAEIPTIKIPEPPDWSAMQAEQKVADAERQARADAMQAETRAFRERLLAALDRQNELLAQLAAQQGGRVLDAGAGGS